MLIVITSTSKVDIELNKWHKVYSIDDQRKDDVYVRFIFAWDLEGNSLYKIPAGTTVILEIEYNGIHYP